MTEQKAIVIGIDGAQLEKLEETSTPNLDSLNIIESFTEGNRGTETEQETFSGPGWGTLLTGVWANKHGIVENEGFDHGEQTDSERTTFIASNKELDDSEVASATDVVPTVLDHLGIEGGEFDGETLLPDNTFELKTATYNIHHGSGNDDLVDLDRIAEVIADTESHVVALQENDIVNGRTDFVNQPQAIAENLSELTGEEWVALEAPAIEFSGGEYGNAILYNDNALNLTQFENILLPGNPAGDGQRSAGIANFQLDETDFDFQFVATHFTNLNEPTEDDSTIQLDSLNLIDDAVALNLPVILAGDLNADLNPVLSNGELDTNNPETIEELQNLGYQIVSPFDDESDTVPSEDFDGVIDYIALKNGDEFEVENSEIVINDLTDLASDHYPVTTTFSISSSVPTPREEALPFTHAHNDYEHQYPLFDALSYGFVSVEADIWLYPDDEDNLRVAHDPVDDPTALPTLEELYLDPLQDLKEEFNNGGVYADGTPLTLLIDLKSEGLPTYQRLDEVLAEYEAESPGLFTTYTLDDSGDYTITPGAVTPIISGDRPLEFMESQEVRYAGYDGRKDDIGTDVAPDFMPLISDNWDNFFEGELAWDGMGTIPEDTEAELNDIVAEVQGEDKIFRFWNLPQDAPSVWQPLYDAGVDLINTDDLEGLSSFIESQLESAVEPVDQILEIWSDASIDYAMVVAHRGGYYENGVTTIPENSLTAIKQSIDAGVEMVELDVWKTEDDHYVIIHDETVDRTTTGSGRVDEFTLDELKELNLIIEDTGEVTSETIPTLEEAFAAVDGEIMFNIDIKLPVEELVNVMNIAREMGVDEQIVIKNPVNNQEQLAAVRETLSQLPFSVEFMPIIDDNLVSDSEFIIEVFEEFQPDAAEMLVRPQGESEEPVEDPGFLFSAEVQEIAEEYDVRLWINTLFANPEIEDNGFINGFRNDVLALSDPDEVFGYWVDAGASILQTDEPLLAVDYLNENGLREISVDEPTVSTNPIFGTLEADTLEITGSNNLVFAGEGNDSVDASLAEGGNRIYGDGDDDTFILGEGDRIIGGNNSDRFFVTAGGDNTMTGGADADQFWIATAEIPESANIITDFMSEEDVIGIAGLGIGFEDLSITQANDNVLIGTNSQDLVILSGIEDSSLNAEHFIFA